MIELGGKMDYTNHFDFPSDDSILKHLLKGSEAEQYSFILTDDLRVEPLSGAPMYRGIPCQVTKGNL